MNGGHPQRSARKCLHASVLLTLLALTCSVIFVYLGQRTPWLRKTLHDDKIVQPSVYTPDWMNETNITELFIKRNRRVRQFCIKYKNEVERLIDNSYQYQYNLGKDKRIISLYARRLSVCLVPKAASTYWTSLIVKLNRLTLTQKILPFSVVDFWKAQERKGISKNNEQVVHMFRNPWHRFVSVYIQKASPEAPFHERKKFVLNLCRAYLSSSNITTLEFEPFLRCAVNAALHGFFNRHWEPAFLRCDICHHDYTAAVSMENIHAEIKHILELARVKDAENLMNEVRRETIRKVEENQLSSDYQHYYRQLKDFSLIDKFREIKKIELEMFGYPDSPFVVMQPT